MDSSVRSPLRQECLALIHKLYTEIFGKLPNGVEQEKEKYPGETQDLLKEITLKMWDLKRRI
jgi:hypothetical protein